MSISVKDILKLDSLRKINLVGGEGGLEKKHRVDICGRMF